MPHADLQSTALERELTASLVGGAVAGPDAFVAAESGETGDAVELDPVLLADLGLELAPPSAAAPAAEEEELATLQVGATAVELTEEELLRWRDGELPIPELDALGLEEVPALVEAAHAARLEGRVLAAICGFEAACVKDPRQVEAGLALGALRLAMGAGDEAAACFARVLAAAPEHPWALLGRAEARRTLADLDGAREDARRVAALDRGEAGELAGDLAALLALDLEEGEVEA